MEAYLEETAWRKGSPWGGNYSWLTPDQVVQNYHGIGREPDATGAIAVTAFWLSSPLALSRDDLLYIDGQIDDGDLTTGRFRTGFNGWPVYLVSKNP